MSTILNKSSSLHFGARIQFDPSIIKTLICTREGVTSVAYLVNRALGRKQPGIFPGQPSARALIEATGNNQTDTVELSLKHNPSQKNFYTVEARYKRNQQTIKAASWRGGWDHATIVKKRLARDPSRRPHFLPKLQAWVNAVALAAQRFNLNEQADFSGQDAIPALPGAIAKKETAGD
jgi:hypothetical protein